jgi:hypothetical protein
MALVLKDRVKETANAPGTGTVTLLGAASGYQSFSVIGDGNTVYYCIADQSGSNWEVGIGTYTSSGTTLARNTILESSNSGSVVNFTTGPQDVFCTYPAEKSVNQDADGNVYGPNLFASNGILAHNSTVSTSCNLGAGYNALAVGPITIGAGASVTVASGQRWLIL